MGNSSSPAPVDTTGAAIATGNSQKYNERGPNGDVTWSVRPGANLREPMPGDYVRSTTLSGPESFILNGQQNNQIEANRAAAGQLATLRQGPESIRNVLYRRSIEGYDRRYGQQEAALRSQLLNSGLEEGSEAYKTSMNDFNTSRNSAYADANDRAAVSADQFQNNGVNRIAALLAAARGQQPVSANSAGGAPIDFSSAAANQYQQALGQSNADNANRSNNLSAGVSLIGTAAAFF